MSISLLGAFLGGVLTLLSPCSVMLLPAFFSYAFAAPGRILARTGLFFLGLLTTLVPMGVLAGTLGALLMQNRSLVVQLASILVILLGLIMILNPPLPAFLTGGATASGTGGLAVFALGTIYGVAGMCAGPLLGAVLTVAALGGNALYGGLVMVMYAAGMVLPLVLLALLWSKIPAVSRIVKPREIGFGRWRTTLTALISGILMILIGVALLITDGTASLGGVIGVSTQSGIENWAITTTSAIPDYVVLILTATIAVVILMTAWLVNRNRKQRHQSQASVSQLDLSIRD